MYAARNRSRCRKQQHYYTDELKAYGIIHSHSFRSFRDYEPRGCSPRGLERSSLGTATRYSSLPGASKKKKSLVYVALLNIWAGWSRNKTSDAYTKKNKQKNGRELNIGDIVKNMNYVICTRNASETSGSLSTIKIFSALRYRKFFVYFIGRHDTGQNNFLISFSNSLGSSAGLPPLSS